MQFFFRSDLKIFKILFIRQYRIFFDKSTKTIMDHLKDESETIEQTRRFIERQVAGKFNG